MGLWTKLKTGWRAWQKIAHAIGNFQARIILTVFYLIITIPFALMMKLTSDPLRLRQKQPSWLERERAVVDLAGARRQF
ncbi:MAG: hypothetical protein HYR55_15750 [Acidobacteria bacterium]|nr:hypothetical protein [Acidobacteriota bacterium]MBI3655587.1 hypothetical protein [Acidobacteriota bacterium]